MNNKQYQKEYYQRTKKAKIKKRIMGSIVCPDIKDYPFCESLGGSFEFFLNRRNSNRFRTIINYRKKLSRISEEGLLDALFKIDENGLYSQVKYSWLVLLTKGELASIFDIKRGSLKHYIKSGIVRRFMDKNLYLVNPHYPLKNASTKNILIKVFIDGDPFAFYCFRDDIELAGADTVEEKVLASAFLLFGENDYDWKIQYSFGGNTKTISRKSERGEDLMDAGPT